MWSLSHFEQKWLKIPCRCPWSSCQAKAGGKKISWLDSGSFCLGLGKTSGERVKKHRKWHP